MHWTIKKNTMIKATFGLVTLVLIIKIAALGYEFGQWLKLN